MVRLHSTRLVNAYTGDLRLAGSRRNTQEDRGEEQKYKVTVNTAIDPVSLIAGGVLGAWFLGHKIDHIADNVISDVKVLTGLPKEAEIQRAISQEKLKERERKLGEKTSYWLTQNHEGGVAASWGAAVGKVLGDTISKKIEDVQNALKVDAASTQPGGGKDAPKKIEGVPNALKPGEVGTQAENKKDAPPAINKK
jgi:hypothetical protein